MLDPYCLIHQKRRSEHLCLYCCICFSPLIPECCSRDAEGTRWDVCAECAPGEGLIPPSPNDDVRALADELGIDLL